MLEGHSKPLGRGKIDKAITKTETYNYTKHCI